MGPFGKLMSKIVHIHPGVEPAAARYAANKITNELRRHRTRCKVRLAAVASEGDVVITFDRGRRQIAMRVEVIH